MNEEPKANGLRCCRACDAPLRLTDSKCWLCGRATPPIPAEEVVVEVVPEAGLARPHAHRRRQSATQFSLASLMLFATLSSVLMGLIVMHPGLGAVLTVFALPALLSTWAISVRAGEIDKPLSIGERVGVFMASWAGFVLLAVAGLFMLGLAIWVLLFVVCGLALNMNRGGDMRDWGQSGLFLVSGIGIVVASLVAVTLYFKFFVFRKRGW